MSDNVSKEVVEMVERAVENEWIRTDDKARIYTNGKDEIVMLPPCRECQNEPAYLVTNQKEGFRYVWPLGKVCEKARQKANRMKAKARQMTIAELELNKAAASALTKAGFETVASVMSYEGDLSEIDGVGPKSVKTIEAFLVEHKLV